jgi:hypothetical protein
MTKVHAFGVALLILTLTAVTTWAQTSGGPETVLIHSGSATLHAMLWRPQGRGPFPGILLNHGSGRTRKDLERLGPYEQMPENSARSSLAMDMYSYTCSDTASALPPTRAQTPST